MKRMKKCLSVVLALVLFAGTFASFPFRTTLTVSATEITPEYLLNDFDWKAEHEWNWDGESYNSENGYVQDVVTGEWATFLGGNLAVADGVATTDSSACYKIETPFSYSRNTTKYFRVEWKGTFVDDGTPNFNRVTHGGSKNTHVALVDYAVDGRAAGTWAIQVGNNNNGVALGDAASKVTDGQEHTFTMIAYNNILHLYVDGEFIASDAVDTAATYDDWGFTHLLGHSVNGGAGNYKGSIDYIKISTCAHPDTDPMYAATCHGELCNICGATVNVVAHESTECDVCGFVGAPSAADALASEDWTATNRWDFNDNLDDSIGGATVTNVRGSATYQDGKVVLSGTNAWKFDKAINIGGLANGLVGMRVDMKATIDWTKSGALRVLGGASGTNSGLLFWLGAAGNLANTGSTGGIGFSPITAQAYAPVLPYDEVEFDRTAEHTYTCIYYIDHIYHYIDGVLVAEKAMAGIANDFEITDFLGCTYASADIAGTIDFIELSVMKGSAKPAPEADYTVSVEADKDFLKVGETVTVNVNVDNTFASGEMTLTFDATKLELQDNAAYTAKVDGNTITIAFYGENDAMTSIPLVFKALANTEDTQVELISAAFGTEENAMTEDLSAARVDKASVSIQIMVADHNVTLPEIFTGNSAVADGADYTFTAADNKNYTYTGVTATMGGQTVEVVDNGDGTYTIAGVTGDLVITGTRTANSYKVTINGEDAEDATYGTDYIFDIPADVAVDGATPGKTYALTSVTIGGVNYTGYSIADKKVTIPGAAITGAIEIVITETTVNPETYTVTVNKDAAVGDVDYEATATAGVDYTFSFNGKGGFTYTVTATVNGEAVTLTEGQGGAYTITATDVTGNIVITITATLNLDGVAVGEYLQLDGTKMWIVSIADWNLEDGYRYTYNGEAMYLYNGKVVYLVVADSLTLDDAKALIAVEDGVAEALVATNDVNGTGTVDANDAQLVYNMYNAQYNGFTESVTMVKYILADVNDSGKVDVNDAVAIVNTMLA